MKRHWKEPVNGLTVFFSEESYTRVLGTVSLEERLAAKFEQDQHGSHSSLPLLTPYQPKSAPAQGHQPLKLSTIGSPELKKKNEEIKTTQRLATKSDGTAETGKKPSSLKVKSQKSSLSSKEQRRYLELFQKYLMSYRPQQPSLAEIKELTEFETLQVRVSSEQAAFLQYTEQVSKSRHFDYNHLLPAARKYVEEKLTHQWRRVDHYPRYYVPDKTIPLAVQADEDYSPTLLYDKLLLELGTFPKVFMPDMSRQNEVPIQYDKVNKRFPSNGRKLSSSKAWNHEACSRDTNIELLAQRHGCQLATCASALRCLVDNHAPKFDQEWEIPVVVRQYEHDYGDISSKQKVVYIDKPFASKAMNNRDKNTLFHKYALKTFITQPSHPRGQRPHHAPAAVKEEDLRKPDSTNPFDDDINMEDLETFGSFDFGKPERRSSVKKCEISKSDKLESFGLLTLSKGKVVTDNPTEKGKSTKEMSESVREADTSLQCRSTGVNNSTGEQDLDNKESDKTSETVSVTAQPDKELATHKLAVSDKPAQDQKKKAASALECAKFNVPSSSEGDTSLDDGLVIDVPDLPSPPQRTTRGQAKKRVSSSSSLPEQSTQESPPTRSSPRLARQIGRRKTSVTAESTDDEHDLVIDLGESSPELGRRKTRSQTSEEFPVPTRILRKRKSETPTSLESDSDASPERQSVRMTRARSSSGTRSRSNSESKSKEENEKKVAESVTQSSVEGRKISTRLNQDLEKVMDDGNDQQKGTEKGDKLDSDPNVHFSPSKVDNIMVKTSTDDLKLLPPTSEAKVLSPQRAGNKRSRLKSKPGLSPLDSILQLQEKMLPTGRNKSEMSYHGTEGDLSEFHHPEEHNVSYHLWTFSGLTVLIRTACHGVLRDTNHKAQPVCIVPKLEYQTKFGVEQVTQSEVSRDWISCYVKPNTKLVRGRINAMTSELIKIDELELGAIVNPNLSFVPAHALASLHNLLLRLTELPAGQYMLSHSKGDNSCQLLKTTDNKRGSYDLKFSYMGFGSSMPSGKRDESDVPWIPIDPTVLLPIHRKQGRIPCTFEPADYIPPAVKKNIQKKKKAQKKKQWQGKGGNKKT